MLVVHLCNILSRLLEFSCHPLPPGNVAVGKDTLGSFAVSQPLALRPGVVWAGTGEFTEYHLAAGADATRRACEPGAFEYPCFNVTEANYMFKHHIVIHKEHICPENKVCSIPFSKFFYAGKRPRLSTRRARAHPRSVRAGPDLVFRGPARARIWAKQIYLEAIGVSLSTRGARSVSENSTHITELVLPSGLSDTIYGLDIYPL